MIGFIRKIQLISKFTILILLFIPSTVFASQENINSVSLVYGSNEIDVKKQFSSSNIESIFDDRDLGLKRELVSESFILNYDFVTIDLEDYSYIHFRTESDIQNAYIIIEDISKNIYEIRLLSDLILELDKGEYKVFVKSTSLVNLEEPILLTISEREYPFLTGCSITPIKDTNIIKKYLNDGGCLLLRDKQQERIDKVSLPGNSSNEINKRSDIVIDSNIFETLEGYVGFIVPIGNGISIVLDDVFFIEKNDYLMTFLNDISESSAFEKYIIPLSTKVLLIKVVMILILFLSLSIISYYSWMKVKSFLEESDGKEMEDELGNRVDKLFTRILSSASTINLIIFLVYFFLKYLVANQYNSMIDFLSINNEENLVFTYIILNIIIYGGIFSYRLIKRFALLFILPVAFFVVLSYIVVTSRTVLQYLPSTKYSKSLSIKDIDFNRIPFPEIQSNKLMYASYSDYAGYLGYSIINLNPCNENNNLKCSLSISDDGSTGLKIGITDIGFSNPNRDLKEVMANDMSQYMDKNINTDIYLPDIEEVEIPRFGYLETYAYFENEISLQYDYLDSSSTWGSDFMTILISDKYGNIIHSEMMGESEQFIYDEPQTKSISFSLDIEKPDIYRVFILESPQVLVNTAHHYSAYNYNYDIEHVSLKINSNLNYLMPYKGFGLWESDDTASKFTQTLVRQETGQERQFYKGISGSQSFNPFKYNFVSIDESRHVYVPTFEWNKDSLVGLYINMFITQEDNELFLYRNIK